MTVELTVLKAGVNVRNSLMLVTFVVVDAVNPAKDPGGSALAVHAKEVLATCDVSVAKKLEPEQTGGGVSLERSGTG